MDGNATDFAQGLQVAHETAKSRERRKKTPQLWLRWVMVMVMAKRKE